MNWFNELVKYFDDLGGAVNSTIDNTRSIIDSLQALKTQIDSMTQFLQALENYTTIIMILLIVQFVVILWIMVGQSSIKKELAEIKAAVKGPVKNGQ